MARRQPPGARFDELAVGMLVSGYFPVLGGCTLVVGELREGDEAFRAMGSDRWFQASSISRIEPPKKPPSGYRPVKATCASDVRIGDGIRVGTTWLERTTESEYMVLESSVVSIRSLLALGCPVRRKGGKKGKNLPAAAFQGDPGDEEAQKGPGGGL
jgi:hypothetical protein